MEDSAYIILGISVFAFFIVKYIVRFLIKKHRYEFCPVCDQKTKIKWRSKEDGTKKPVRMGSKFVFGTKVIVYRFVILCEHCGHEIEI